MKKIARELLSVLVLAEWGGVMLYLKFSGRLTSFLHPNFHALVCVTGVLLLLCAVLMFLTPEESHAHGHEGHSHDDCCGHDHQGSLEGRSLLVFMVLLLPFGFAAWMAPKGYGAVKVHNSELVENAASIPSRNVARQQVREPVSVNPALPPLPVKNKPMDSEGTAQAPSGDMLSQSTGPMLDGQQPLVPDKNGNIPTSVVELVCAAYDPPGLKEFQGRKVVLTGQFMPLPPGEKAGSRFNLLRMLMVCCAADARPVCVMVDTKKITDFKKPKEMEWMEVAGRVTFEKRFDVMVPVITADKMRSIEAPDDAFLY